MEPSPPAVAADAADLLFSLPAHLLDGILGRLDIRDAVRTSALSRAWRHRWESLPALALSFPDGTPPAAVDRVLLHYTGPRVPPLLLHRRFGVRLPHVDNPAACVIEAPNLHSLTLGSTDDFDWRFGELPCLQYASINVSEPEDLDFRKFLARLSQVRELTLWLPGNGVEIGTTPFTFYNLKSLELSTYFWDMNQILLMFSLLRSFPNLEKLTIEVRAMVGEETEWEFLSAQWTDGMCANLQIVEICSCCQGLPISFMKLILSKASHLRTLSVDTCPVSQDDPLNKLLKCRRASAQAQVLFKLNISPKPFTDCVCWN
ncbi:unnamed protein product [Urochloa decumbens]|uniref:F-box domain-containing protein n=1 Tax=Urochloa decumbens TaxID=240449 RepID=A0ABC9H162_9POAL